MKYLVSLLAILATLGLLMPGPVQGQNKDILALQRDMADLTRRVEALRANQSERLDAIEGLLKQAAEATHAISGELHALQQNLQQSMQKSLAEQQSRVSDPIAAVRSGMDNVGQDVLAVRGDLTSLNTRVGKMEEALNNIQAAIRTLNAPPAAPPPSASDSANVLFSSAERDFLTGNNELALTEFKQYWDLYPASPNAPRALLFIGQIYDRVKQYPDARMAFDTILERFPDSTTTPEAAYWKAEMLAKEGNRTAAITEFENFSKKYPADLNAPHAASRVQELRRQKGK